MSFDFDFELAKKAAQELPPLQRNPYDVASTKAFVFQLDTVYPSGESIGVREFAFTLRSMAANLSFCLAVAQSRVGRLISPRLSPDGHTTSGARTPGEE
jgi:hypothetical protein